MRRTTVILTMSLLASCGCGNRWPFGESTEAPPAPPTAEAADAPPTAVTPARPPVAVRPVGAGPVLARVNGRPVPLRKLTDVLVAAYGMSVAKDVIYLELVEQQGAKRNITVSDAEVAAEHQRTLKERMSRFGPPNRWEAMFEQILAQNNVSRGHWMLICRRNALLRKLAPSDMPVADQEVQLAYGKLYGQKVQIRHIEVGTFREAEAVLARLKKGDEFTAVAQEVSLAVSKQNGGLLPPFTEKSDKLPELLRKVAFSLKNVGDLSDPILTGQSYNIVRLEKIIPPAEPLEKVRGDVEQLLRNEKTRVWGNQLLGRLVKAAEIDFVQPILKEQYDKSIEARKAMRGQTP